MVTAPMRLAYSNVLYLFQPGYCRYKLRPMAESRIIISTADLIKTFNIWLSVIRQRRPDMIRDLWTRRSA